MKLADVKKMKLSDIRNTVKDMNITGENERAVRHAAKG